MRHIGEFKKDSTILLELLTKDRENQSIVTDYPPTATIEHYSRNGLQEVDNVKLETMEEGSRHAKDYRISQGWSQGKYLITYKATIKNKTYTTQESFSIIPEVTALAYQSFDIVGEDTNPVEVEPVTSDIEYIMPADFQSPSTIEVDGNRIIVTVSDNALYNHTYRVVLDESIQSVSGNTLGKTKTITYTSEYKPVFATPLEVRSVLGSLYKYFKPHDVYAALRDAGQKAMQLLGNIADPNNSRYRELRATDTAYFPIQKYSAYEAARSLMTSLMVCILNGDTDDISGGGMISETGGSIKLGDFSLAGPSSQSGVGGSVEKEETPLQKLQVLIQETEKELKFWQDAMMGHNRRGYAKPISTSFKTAAGIPEGRDFE